MHAHAPSWCWILGIVLRLGNDHHCAAERNVEQHSTRYVGTCAINGHEIQGQRVLYELRHIRGRSVYLPLSSRFVALIDEYCRYKAYSSEHLSRRLRRAPNSSATCSPYPSATGFRQWEGRTIRRSCWNESKLKTSKRF